MIAVQLLDCSLTAQLYCCTAVGPALEALTFAFWDRNRARTTVLPKTTTTVIPHTQLEDRMCLHVIRHCQSSKPYPLLNPPLCQARSSKLAAATAVPEVQLLLLLLLLLLLSTTAATTTTTTTTTTTSTSTTTTATTTAANHHNNNNTNNNKHKNNEHQCNYY